MVALVCRECRLEQKPPRLHEVNRVPIMLAGVAACSKKLNVVVRIRPAKRQRHDVVQVRASSKRLFAAGAQPFLQLHQLWTQSFG